MLANDVFTPLSVCIYSFSKCLLYMYMYIVLPDEGVVRWKSLPGLASASDEEGLERDPLADEHFPRHDFLVNAESMEEVSCVLKLACVYV